MSTENYLLSVNFPSGLNNIQLLNEINDNGIIIKQCNNVRTDNDNVYIDFDDNLLIAEKTELDSLISSYNYNDGSSRISHYSITNKAMTINNETLLDNWSVVSNSNYVIVDPVTGIFYPEAGYYSMVYQAVISSLSVASKLGARLENITTGVTSYMSVVDSSNLLSVESGYDAGQFENLTFYFDGQSQYKIYAKVNGNEIMNFNIQIIKLPI